MMGHFMNNFYALKDKTELATPHAVDAISHVKADAKVLKYCLRKAKKGIIMNLLTCRQPTHIIAKHACEHGLGVFHLESGVSWSWVIPEYM